MIVVARRYVPFGRLIQDYLVQLGLGWAVPHYGWQQGSVNLDEAFVTPLVVTQAVNLVLETFVPCVPSDCDAHGTARTFSRAPPPVVVPLTGTCA